MYPSAFPIMLGAVTVTMGSGSGAWRKDRWEPGEGDEVCGRWVWKAECEKAVPCLPGGVMSCLLRKPWPSGHFPLSSGRSIHTGTLVPSVHVHIRYGQPGLSLLASVCLNHSFSSSAVPGPFNPTALWLWAWLSGLVLQWAVVKGLPSSHRPSP